MWTLQGTDRSSVLGHLADVTRRRNARFAPTAAVQQKEGFSAFLTHQPTDFSLPFAVSQLTALRSSRETDPFI
jgi:hypothetical protein